MTIVLTNAQKRNLITKAKSGDYYVRLTNYNNKKGQYILVFPTNRGLAKGISFFKNFYPVIPPNIPRPNRKVQTFDKRGGAAYKEGRFFRIDNTVAKVLGYKD